MAGGVVISIDRVASALPGFPDHFTTEHIEIARSLLAVLIRDRTIDEAVWFQVIRYAEHRYNWVALANDLANDPEEDAKGFGSMKVQRMAHEQKCIANLEGELLVTPRSRADKTATAQTSFIDLLIGQDAGAKEEAGIVRKVMPFQPIGRKAGV